MVALLARSMCVFLVGLTYAFDFMYFATSIMLKNTMDLRKASYRLKVVDLSLTSGNFYNSCIGSACTDVCIYKSTWL